MFKWHLFSERDVSGIGVIGCKLLLNKGMIYLTTKSKWLYIDGDGKHQFIENLDQLD